MLATKKRTPKPNAIEFEDGAISIQSCDDTVAHIGVFLNGRHAYHHVSIPGLVREWRKVYYNELKPAEYDRVLQEHKTSVLEKIKMLNATIPTLGNEKKSRPAKT